MGIESEQLVFDYLSRVGDLAHSTDMTAAERARLVSGLRGEIDRRRAEEGGAQSKSAVKKILSRLGPPEDVVASRAYSGSPGTSTVPEPRAEEDAVSRPSLRKPDSPPEPAGSKFPKTLGGAAPPHLAGVDELGPGESDPDWWRADTSPYGDGDTGFGGFLGPARAEGSPGETVPGFVGGIELPEVLKRPPGDSENEKPEVDAGAPPVAPAAAAGAAGAAGLWAALRKRRKDGKGKPAAAARSGGAVELLAAALLIAGAVIGSPVPLGLGWLAAWWSPKLSRTEAKWAALGMPGLVLGGTVLWLWGRMDGRWGDPLAQGGPALEQAMTQAFPVLLRVAAVASALFLIWRARRPAPA